MKSAHKKEKFDQIIVTEAGRQPLHISYVSVFVCSFVFLSVFVFVTVFVVLIPLAATICYLIIVTRTGRQLLHRANKQPMMSWWV